MGPKKKEEEIDLSTLPELRSINLIILCRGRKARAASIHQRLQKECERFLIRVRKAEVLEHAKEKGIYVDPATLTDKQKKDQKYMESICTELTPQVLAKATKSLLTALTLKARIDRKTNPDKPHDRTYDLLYVFEEDLPNTTDQFQELAKCSENIKYVIVIDPKVSWANAPQVPQDNQEQQEYEEVKEYRQLLKKEESSPEDVEYQNQVDKRIQHIRQLRTHSHPHSLFRNTTVSILDTEIDPYHEQQSLDQLAATFLDTLNRLNIDAAEFDEWRKEKHSQSIGDPLQVEPHTVHGNSPLSLLHALAQGLDDHLAHSEALSDEQQIMNLINGFSIEGAAPPLNDSMASSVEEQEVFVGSNEYVGPEGQLRAEIRRHLHFPGINRFQMPETPAKSQKLRKLQQAQYALFLGEMEMAEFQRRQQLLNFEDYIKQIDEERTYSFADRNYQQHHDQASIQRELYLALELNQYSIGSRYDEASDKLYLMLVYKNNPRRVSRRVWEANWKVLPNFQNWLAHFKNNEANLANTHFFDIDYEKVGAIAETIRTHTLKTGNNGAVIVSRTCSASNSSHSLLYGLKDQLVFGVHTGRFFAENGSVRLYHLQNPEGGGFETVILLGEVRIRLLEGGNVMIEKGSSSRLVTPSGYTVIYGRQGNTILHPSGAITYGPNTYINHNGYGLKDGHLYTSPTLKRRVPGGEIIKRDDGTVIANSLQGAQLTEQWARFYDGTEYQISQGRIRIEKEGEPFLTCHNGNVRVTADGLTVRLTRRLDGYTAVVEFLDGSQLRILKDNVYVFHADEEGQIQVSLTSNTIISTFGSEEVKVTPQQAIYKKDGKQFDAREDEQRYGEDEILPADYIEPRLFVVSNDNTAVELLNEKMYQAYLKRHSHSIDRVYEKKSDRCTECHVVAKQGKTQGKQIRSSLSVSLDVFDNSQLPAKSASHAYLSLSSFLRFDPLTSQDVAQMHRIRADTEAYRKQNAKEENEFGAQTPEITKARIQAKILTLKRRQEGEKRVQVDTLRETARNFHIQACQEIRKQLDREYREKQLKSQIMKKKNSIVREYRKVTTEPRRHRPPAEPLPDFMHHYFLTHQGARALSEMPEWVFRPKQAKPAVQLDPEIQQELANTGMDRAEEESEDRRERYDTVEVNLNPKPQKEIYIKPSVFTQRQIEEERTAFQQEKKAYKYHQAKRKDFNLYGEQRKSRPEVAALLRTQPASEINQKYLVTQAPLDRKVKISSMRNKLTSAASSMIEMRKEGPHTLLIKTIDKGNDINRLLERRTMMVQADLNDKLQRDVLINPTEANFGVLTIGRTYELRIDIKNQDVISQRITIKRPKSIHLKAHLSEMGPIAMGMNRKVLVVLKASPEIIGRFTDQFDIVTKHEIYHIPVSAHIVGEGQQREPLARGVIEVQENSKKKNQSTLELPRINK